jgi:hypothetical protein
MASDRSGEGEVIARLDTASSLLTANVAAPQDSATKPSAINNNIVA